LRERPRDLRTFAEKFVSFFAGQTRRDVDGFEEAAWQRLLEYSWPGNLRELRNAIERAVILTRGKKLEERDLPELPRGGPPLTTSSDEVATIGAALSLEDLEAAHIRSVLGWTKTLQEAAEVLGIDQATLYRKRKKLSLG
jgi:NtrC-family two-component system response regulator AlgB